MKTKRIKIPAALYARVETLRSKLEERFHVNLGDADLFEYLTEKALERIEEWERRTRGGEG